MLIILATLLFWIPATVGYGIGLTFVARRFGSTPEIDPLAESMVGMFAISTIVNVIHFFSPIGSSLSLTLGLLGWLLFVIRLRMSPLKIHAGSIGWILLWVTFLAFWSTQAPRNPDAALYHLQLIKWTNQNTLPIGLANLHDRFGFNCSWFSFVAVLQIPWIQQEGGNALSASALLNFFLGVSVFRAAKRLKTGANTGIHDFFLLLVPFLIFSDVMRRTVSSPSPDYAVMVLCVAVTYYALRYIATAEDFTIRLFEMIILTVFAITIKPNAALLAFLLFSVLLLTLKRNLPIAWKKLAQYTLLCSAIPLVIWFARGIALSGYWNYPNAQTAISNLMWTVPVRFADHTLLAIKSDARFTNPNKMQFSEWIGPWAADFMSTSDFVVLLIVAASAFLLILRYGWNRVCFWILFALSVAIVSWFLLAPSLRFGAGYLWGATLVLFSAAISQFSVATAKRWIILVAFVCIASFVPRFHLAYFGLPPVRKALRAPKEFLLKVPVPLAKTTTATTANGIRVHIPNDGTFDCWLSDLPCTPWLSSHLVAVQNSDSTFKMFYIRGE